MTWSSCVLAVASNQVECFVSFSFGLLNSFMMLQVRNSLVLGTMILHLDTIFLSCILLTKVVLQRTQTSSLIILSKWNTRSPSSNSNTFEFWNCSTNRVLTCHQEITELVSIVSIQKMTSLMGCTHPLSVNLLRIMNFFCRKMFMPIELWNLQ